MCEFFSFVSDGSGNIKYFTAKDRQALLESNPKQYNPDSHASIAAFHGVNEDSCNKYEWNTEGFKVDQINATEDDSELARKWIAEFSQGKEF